MTTGRLPNISDGLERIVAALGTALGTEVTVRSAGGAFDGGEIRRHVAAAPAVIVACLGLSDYAKRGAGGWSVQAQLVAYVLTRDKPQTKGERDRLALDLVSETLREVGRANWADPDAFGLTDPASIEAQNLYNGDLDSVAVALWAVLWTQPYYLIT